MQLIALTLNRVFVNENGTVVRADFLHVLTPEVKCESKQKISYLELHSNVSLSLLSLFSEQCSC